MVGSELRLLFTLDGAMDWKCWRSSLWPFVPVLRRYKIPLEWTGLHFRSKSLNIIIVILLTALHFLELKLALAFRWSRTDSPLWWSDRKAASSPCIWPWLGWGHIGTRWPGWSCPCGCKQRIPAKDGRRARVKKMFLGRRRSVEPV